AAASGMVSLFIGMVTPKSFRSEAILNIESAKTGVNRIMSPLVSEFDETEIALNKAAMLMHSPVVLDRVAAQLLARKDVEVAIAFPNRLRYDSFGERLELLTLRLSALGIRRF